ncbi:Uncharacterized protein SAMN04488038_12218 [Solimonas aquatica]|uniref:Photosynthesis system II assembly factor Ycf48/Hcf136-like domain-containing protein n=2 Tax=Solimonas aquatica TaxID=489703 RepID=A0A1H9MF60_9GAMM|nr:Uncharacterized protein SAMN04488038_12218 [Solimonas aquatica]
MRTERSRPGPLLQDEGSCRRDPDRDPRNGERQKPDTMEEKQMNTHAQPLPALQIRRHARRHIAGWPAIVFVLLVSAAAIYAFSPRPTPVFPATQIHPQDLLVTALARQDSRVIAVGEQGHILIADDVNGPWREASVEPRRASTLTQLRFIDDRTVIAVGHDAWILRSEDAGASWKTVFHIDSPKDGPLPPANSAAAAPADAGFVGPPDDTTAADSDAPPPLQADPLLGIAGPYANRLYAFGAFGMMLSSDDQGRSWQRLYSPVFGDHHLNAMTQLADGALLVVGERGLLARSEDGGKSWIELPSIYGGSFFGALRLPSGATLIYGMRGHVFTTSDNARSWRPLEMPTSSSLFGGAVNEQGEVVLVGAASTIISSPDGVQFTLRNGGGRNDYASVLPLDGARWLTGSDGGIRLVSAQATAGARP